MAVNRAPLGNRRSRKGKNKYLQGSFMPQHPDKYIGQLPILYRSSWEHAFCRFCDINEKVVKWSAEFLEIPYQITNDNHQVENHRYYPDFYIEMTTNEPDKYERLVIELKPKHETEPPKPQKRQTLKMLENFEYAQRMYKRNLYKWAFTKEWCQKRHIKFIIITEDDLKKKGLI